MESTFRFSLASALLFGVCAAASAANLVQNPGFETGDFTGWTTTVADHPWTVSPSGPDGLVPNSGTFFAETGCVGATTCLAYGMPGASDLSQTLATTTGQSYTLSFFVTNSTNPNPSELDVYWGGTKLVGLSPVPGTSPNYTEFTETGILATGAATTLEFLGQQDPSYFALDDVSVTATAVPLPSTYVLLLSGIALLVLIRRRGSSDGLGSVAAA